MQLYNFESWFTLLTGFAIFIMGLRVFWLDADNRMYQAFMLSTFLLFIQNLFFFLIGQSTDMEIVLKLRVYQESSWNIAVFFICITMWFYARQFIPRMMKRWENHCFYASLVLNLIFIFLQAFTPLKHGELLLNDANKWVITINHPHWYDWLRMIWTFLIYGMSIYFSYLPFKYAPSRYSKWLRGLVFTIFSIIMLGSFIQNYVLTIFFQTPSTINESINVAIGALFSGLMIINLQLNDLNSEYAIPNLLKTMTNWFILTDKQFNIRRINTAFLQYMGKDMSYWQNQPVGNLFEAGKWSNCEKKIAALARNETINCEFKIETDDQVYYLLFAVTPVFNRTNILSFKKDNVKAYAFVGTDLSQFKASENRIKAYSKELENSVRALESFAFIASHDLKEPIRNIGNFAGLLRHRLGNELTTDISEYIDYIEQSVKNMNQLLDSIMAISRVGCEEVNFELVNMNELLLKKQQQLKKILYHSNAQLKIENLPIINGEKQLIRQLFQNLIENSLKYNTTGQPLIRIYATASPASKNHVLIKIEDNGIGIEKEYRKQVFLMFKRLHSRQIYKGSGIGLAICKRIMELHQGQIWIEDSRKEKGITFVLSFPIVA